ncbi:hypothetical protein SH501x_001147 [Pirellulaceae bacterium SH501]
MDSLFVGVSSWIIQDGNYPDFRIGDAINIALEFHPYRACESKSKSTSIMRIAFCHYRVNAKAIFLNDNLVVLDFGYLAYDQATPPRWMRSNSYVEADVYLGIDPFLYFEELHAIRGIPELRYRFRVVGIELETTPWMSTVDLHGRAVRKRDDTQTSFSPVAETDAWSDDDGNAHYILELARIENLPN